MGEPPRLLAVVAHPDDESFGLGSVLAWAAAHGADTAVCCATRGEAGEPAPGSGLAPEALPVARIRELREAAALLGVGRVDLLDYADSGMVGEPTPGTLVHAPFEDVVTAVVAEVDAVRPSVVVTLDAGDGHRDHARIRDATLAAVERAAHRVERVYLAGLARSLMRRWVEHQRSVNPGRAHLDPDVAAIGTPDEELTTVLDTSAQLDLRWAAIRAHASQVSPFEDLPADLQRAFLATDRLRRVVPPWAGGPPEESLF
jgi:LmbE family N-acetylglucosaminyl deacetylase